MLKKNGEVQNQHIVLLDFQSSFFFFNIVQHYQGTSSGIYTFVEINSRIHILIKAPFSL